MNSTLHGHLWLEPALPRLAAGRIAAASGNVLAVGEDPAHLVVYAALGKAARDWPSHDKIVETLRTMADDETLIVQSGKPIGLIKTHDRAPIVFMANCNMVGQWAKAENFYDLQHRNLSAGAG